MLCVVAPLLHRLPIFVLDTNVTLPPWQKVTGPFAVIDGGGDILFGAATPLPFELIHPFAAVCVTVYIPGADTDVDAVVAPLLHNNDPGAVVDNKDDPQLLTTVTTGVAGIVLGAEVSLPAPLVHPLAVVCLTV